MGIISKIKEKLKNRDAKTLLENFISLSALQLVGMILPLLTLPYILRVVGFEKYGIIVFAASLTTYFQGFTDYSFRITAVRDIAIFRNSKTKIDIIYSKVLMIKSIFLFISLLIISLIVYLYPPFYEYRLVYFFSSLMLVGYTLFPEWFFQGIEKMRYITYLNLGIKFFFTICVFIFIKNEEDYWIYPLLQSCGFIGAGIVGQLIIIKKYKCKFIWLKFKIIKTTIKESFPLFINQLVPTLYNNTGTFLLGLLTNNTLVGVYEAIKTVTNLCVILLGIISRVFFPFLNRNKSYFPKYEKMMLYIAMLLCIVSIAFYPLIFWFLSIDYEYSLIVLIILTFGLIGFSMSNVYGVNYFIVNRQDKLVMRNTVIYSFFGFVSAYPLIHYWGIIGAAVNLTMVRIFMGGSLFVKYKIFVKNEGKCN